MPATAGRVRMPADNRLSVSASLKTSEIWQKSVGYDPYAPLDQQEKQDEILQHEKAKSLFALARLTGSSSEVTPGSCRKCGYLGHLEYQCRNVLNTFEKSDKMKTIPTNAERSESEEELDEDKLLGSDDSDSSSNRNPSPKRKRKHRYKSSKHKKISSEKRHKKSSSEKRHKKSSSEKQYAKSSLHKSLDKSKRKSSNHKKMSRKHERQQH